MIDWATQWFIKYQKEIKWKLSYAQLQQQQQQQFTLNENVPTKDESVAIFILKEEKWKRPFMKTHIG